VTCEMSVSAVTAGKVIPQEPVEQRGAAAYCWYGAGSPPPRIGPAALAAEAESIVARASPTARPVTELANAGARASRDRYCPGRFMMILQGPSNERFWYPCGCYAKEMPA
jgi:hypothetical protein